MKMKLLERKQEKHLVKVHNSEVKDDKDWNSKWKKKNKTHKN